MRVYDNEIYRKSSFLHCIHKHIGLENQTDDINVHDNE